MKLLNLPAILAAILLSLLFLGGAGYPQEKPELDLTQLTTIDDAMLVEIVRDWPGSDEYLSANGITDAARRILLTRLVQESLADITYLHRQDIGKISGVGFTVPGAKGFANVSIPLRSLKAYEALTKMYDAGTLAPENVKQIVSTSAIEDVLSQALTAGVDIDGLPLALVIAGVLHSNGTLILVDE